jgi:hypothetical protein
VYEAKKEALKKLQATKATARAAVEEAEDQARARIEKNSAAGVQLHKAVLEMALGGHQDVARAFYALPKTEQTQKNLCVISGKSNAVLKVFVSMNNGDNGLTMELLSQIPLSTTDAQALAFSVLGKHERVMHNLNMVMQLEPSQDDNRIKIFATFADDDRTPTRMEKIMGMQITDAQVKYFDNMPVVSIEGVEKAVKEAKDMAAVEAAEAEAPAPVAGARFLPNVRRMGGIHALPAPEEGGAQARARNHGMSSVKIFHESLNVALVNSAIKASIPAVNNVLVSFDIPQEHSRYLDRASPVCAFGITKFAGKLGFATPLSAASFHVVNHGLPETLPEVGMLAGTFVGTKVIAKGVDLLPPQYRMPINIALILGPAFIARNDDMSLSKTKTEILQDLAYENSQPLGAGVIAFGVATGFGVATSPALAVAVGVGLVSDYAWTAYDKGDIATMPSSVESVMNFAEDYNQFSQDMMNTVVGMFTDTVD